MHQVFDGVGFFIIAFLSRGSYCAFLIYHEQLVKVSIFLWYNDYLKAASRSLAKIRQVQRMT